MLSNQFILERFNECPLPQQVEVLRKALLHMKADHRRSEADCIALAMNIPLFPEVIRLDHINDYHLTMTFDNGEQRTLDLRTIFDAERHYDKMLLDDLALFKTVKVEDGTLVWKEVGFLSTDLDGEERFHSYDIDPGLLYEYSTPASADKLTSQ